MTCKDFARIAGPVAAQLAQRAGWTVSLWYVDVYRETPLRNKPDQTAQLLNELDDYRAKLETLARRVDDILVEHTA